LGTVNFLVRFGGIPGSFGLAMGNLARLRLAKIRTMARPNSPDMPPKRTKKVRLGRIIIIIIMIVIMIVIIIIVITIIIIIVINKSISKTDSKLTCSVA